MSNNPIVEDHGSANAAKARLIVVSGPSGVGKGTLCQRLMAQYADDLKLCLSVSMTSRAPRAGEQEGIAYYFVSPAAFRQSINTGQLLEWAEYDGAYYGTPRPAVMAQLAAGNHVILEIEPQGAFQVRDHFGANCLLVFIAPPSLEALEARLLGRGQNSPIDIARRLQIAQQELAQQTAYDVIIINDQLDQALAKLVEAIELETVRAKT